MAVARRIEGKYSKDEILTAYLNRIYFGQQCYGIAQAADLYFGKKVADLTLAECATLAGLVRGPSIYNPVYSPEAAAKVRNATLERMFECEFITQEQLWQALREPMAVAGKREARPGSYPVLVVSRELGDLDCCCLLYTSSPWWGVARTCSPKFHCMAAARFSPSASRTVGVPVSRMRRMASASSSDTEPIPGPMRKALNVRMEISA